MASHSFVTRHCKAVQRHDHSSIGYIYAADGTKLRTIHRPAGSTALTDSIDYVGNLILNNGQPSMYLFEGGYASFNANGAVNGWHYYIQDYMGNNRMVVNKNGTTEQVTHYYPYGGVIGDISTNENVQKYKFEGKELDRTFGLDNYDIHARQYFAMMPSWDRIDRLAEKYYGFSPYSYCGGDPVNRIDSDGKLIKFAEGSSKEFIDKFYRAYSTLCMAGAGDIITKAMMDVSYTITIAEISNDDKRGSKYNYKTGNLYWAPEQGLSTEGDYILSPMEVLQHEFDHGVHDGTNHEEHVDSSMKDNKNPYDSKEEQRVITGSEQDTAKKLGKLREGQKTRTNHSGKLIVTEDVTSSRFLRLPGQSEDESMDEFVVRP